MNNKASITALMSSFGRAFHAEADESRTHIGFDGQISAHAALKLLTIRQPGKAKKAKIAERVR